MASALIGYTGFVGSNLLRARSFDDLYNSSNIGNIVGKHYDLLVCAGVPAVKWKANKEPDRDREQIAALIDPLSKVTADRFILISTIDVYSNPSKLHDESKDPFDPEAQPYGKHRLEVEKWATAHFSDTMIVRLPALFGPGLKKNVIFDLLHDNQTDKIDPASSFQWYSLIVFGMTSRLPATPVSSWSIFFPSRSPPHAQFSISCFPMLSSVSLLTRLYPTGFVRDMPGFLVRRVAISHRPAA
ncbi:hypothetical protein Q644_07920 [Brucella intermedia 229E]|uniref:NAD-dependent epimerase/dehydratase domain-containing protein n=1 Tax=Brucella intermedia 229E TaxID=1337887 RepID=U4V1W6_9HYPH|nr:hypothetical protein Q644_07920 [Brucella intermedia 229E]